MAVPHFGFIVAAYAVTAVAVVAMIAVILWDYRTLRAELRTLEGGRRDRLDNPS